MNVRVIYLGRSFYTLIQVTTHLPQLIESTQPISLVKTNGLHLILLAII
jgi:hypothetical protein